MQLHLDDLTWPNAEGVEDSAWANVQVAYTFTQGYPCTYYEPGEPDQVDIHTVLVLDSNVPRSEWPALARMILNNCEEVLADAISHEHAF